MTKEAKIYLFKDRPDYTKKITNDNIYNISGEKGSGKSFLGNMKESDESCIVIHLDPLFIEAGNKYHKYSSEVRKILLDKYGEELKPDLYFEENYYQEIIKYLKKHHKTSYIEGGSIAEIKNASKIIGTVIIKRTGVFKCFIRTLKRDYNNEYYMSLAVKKYGKLAKIYRLRDVIKRRKKIFKTYHKIENFIEKIEKYNV